MTTSRSPNHFYLCVMNATKCMLAKHERQVLPSPMLHKHKGSYASTYCHQHSNWQTPCVLLSYGLVG